MMDIPKWPIAGEREIELLKQVLESGQWGGFNNIVPRFEQQFAAFQHCQHGISAANGTVTLEMALAISGVGPGDEVIVPAISFVSTATAVSRVGATPVFVDIEPFSFNLDPDRAADAIRSNTKAIIPSHFGGPLADMDRFTKLCADRNLILIEDAAHAQGSEWNGRRAGSFGLTGSFSFQNGKVITAGEGGMLTSNDARFAEAARSFANSGRQVGSSFYHHFTLGSNFRLTGLQAAVLTAQFERLPEQNARRGRNAAFLRAELSGVEGITFQKIPAQVTANCCYLLLGSIDAAKLGVTRDEFQSAMTARGIPCTPFYPHTLYNNPLYRKGGCRVEPCPVAEARVRDAFWFPHRVLLAGESSIREIAESIREVAVKAHAA